MGLYDDKTTHYYRQGALKSSTNNNYFSDKELQPAFSGRFHEIISRIREILTEIHPVIHFVAACRPFFPDLLPGNTLPIGSPNRLLHTFNFVIGQGSKKFGSFSVGQPALILKAYTDEQVDLPIRHVHNFLNG